MKVQAVRGVCIGVGQSLLPGDTADLDTATAQYLVSIGAVKPAPVDVSNQEFEKPAKKPAKE